MQHKKALSSLDSYFELFDLKCIYRYEGREMVGKRAVKFWVNIEFMAARLPTLQIWDEKKFLELSSLKSVIKG